jgi:ATPase subunit of ABC transporter with duplicated ATPase domains
VWLEQWLTQRFGGILLVVSHDQVFLDTVCTDILELKSTLGGRFNCRSISCAHHTCERVTDSVMSMHKFYLRVACLIRYAFSYGQLIRASHPCLSTFNR